MQSLRKGEQPIFLNPQDLGERPWGKEELLVLVPSKYMLKKLTIKKGAKGGFQYHRLKDECGVLISGSLLVRFDDGNGGVSERVINPGEAFHFPPGVPHQEEALEECVIIEGSTNHFNDRVRVDEIYGLGKPEGMPTTAADEIITK